MADILLGAGETPLSLHLPVANRHGLIAGATGTGKSVTLRVLAEGLSAAGVPVFMADVKGDLAGMCQPGKPDPRLEQRARDQKIGDFRYGAAPVIFWDVFGENGHPIRATVSDMGPFLLARLLALNETQTGVLNLVFKVADDEGLLLIDLKDLRAMLTYVGDNAKRLTTTYGNVGASSIGAIQRALLQLEQQGGERFFGEPPLGLSDLMLTDGAGRGAVNILAAERLVQSPKVYATFLLWLLSELFEELPEEGDLAKPKLVFFFDEAHLLFEDAPKALVDKVEQVVRLIRSKGVGVYFVTQNPLDLPEDVLGQLGNRVQHALRAFTARDQKAVRAAAETFRSNPSLDTAKVITELGVGEALVSLLDGKGTPGIVQRAMIRPPASRLGAITAEERKAAMGMSPVAGRYDALTDRESAFEVLRGGTEAPSDEVGRGAPTAPAGNPWGGRAPAPLPQFETPKATPRRTAPRPQPPAAEEEEEPPPRRTGRGRSRETVVEAVTKSAARSVASSIGSAIGRQIMRGILGSMTGGSRRR